MGWRGQRLESIRLRRKYRREVTKGGSSASSSSVVAQASGTRQGTDKVAVAGVGSGVGVCVGAVVGVGVGSGVGVGVDSGVTPGCAVTVGVGTAPADGVGLGASEHPVSSMARSIAPAPTNPRALHFDIITLLGARLSATVAYTVAFRMTRGKVSLYLLRGVHLYLSDKVRSNIAVVVEQRTLIALVEA